MSTARRLAPELENGAVMRREEFHAAYAERHDLRRAELIEGVVFMPSPVRFESHDRQASLLRGWLFAYSLLHADCLTGNDATLILGDSEVQPDAFLMHAGSVPMDADGYLVAAPQLVVEIAGSTRSRDLHSKLRVYERHGVDEYIVWRTLDGEIDWFRRRAGAFVRISPDADGIIESAVFPGLKLAVAKALAYDANGMVGQLR